LPGILDYDKLKASCDVTKLRSFERELEQALDREGYERRRKVEDAKRAKEKRARKKRLKTASQASS